MDADMDIISVHIRDRLDQVRADLPADVDRIDIRSFDTEDFPVLEYSLTWLGENNQELVNVYNQLILPRVQRLEGVANVVLEGLREKDLLIEVDQKAMAAYKLDFRTINRALNRQQISMSPRDMSPKAANASPCAAWASLKPLIRFAICPFAPISRSTTLPMSRTIIPNPAALNASDGRPSLNLEVQTSPQRPTWSMSAHSFATNSPLIHEEVRAKDKLRMHMVRDRSIDVTNSITSLSQSAILGGLLAVIAIFIFLRNFRSTLIIGSAIPISVLTVFLIMYFMRQSGSNITLNLISMMGLMVAIRMLVDPAVVALENIFRKRFEIGQDARAGRARGQR